MGGSAFRSRCRSPRAGRVVFWLIVAAACGPARWLAATAEETVAAPTAVPVIESGTPVEDAGRPRWNRLVLLATPRFASGDVGDVSDAIRDTVSRFTFAILATVRPVEQPAATGAARRHELAEVGVGYCTSVGERLTVVAPDAKLAGFSLDFLGRQVLSAKRRSLDDIMCVGRSCTAIVFDAPSLMLREGDHRELLVRHLVRIDPQSGDCSTCAWLVDADAASPVEDPLRLIEAGTREERGIHVDGSRFTFGFPTRQACALEDLPPGRRVAWSASLRTAATAASYSEQALDRLTKELDAAIAGSRGLRSAARPGDKTE